MRVLMAGIHSFLHPSDEGRVRRPKGGALPRHSEGFSLLLVMFLVGVGFPLMTGVLRWSGVNSNLADRYNEYYTALAAAEAATEKVISQISRDFQNGGPACVDGNLSAYGSSYPTPAEAAEWGEYEFTDPVAGPNRTYVAKLLDWEFAPLNWKYPGFRGYAATYRVVSNARNVASANNVVAGVRQDIQVADVPLFEFGIFYAVDLEVNPRSEDFLVSGRVHANGNIYCEPDQRNVTFVDDVTTAQQIVHDHHPNDPENRAF